MKKNILLVITLFISFFAHAQQQIKIEELNKHIGDSVTVCTKIYGGIYLDKSSEKITLLNAGGVYPNAPLTLLIKANTRKQFKEAPESYFKNKNVCISGKLILYKEKPEIIINDAKQIEVK